MFIFSDPFSWDESVSTPDLWLGGKSEGEYAGRGLDVIGRLFSGKNKLIQPQLDVVEQGAVSWKIRKNGKFMGVNHFPVHCRQTLTTLSQGRD